MPPRARFTRVTRETDHSSRCGGWVARGARNAAANAAANHRKRPNTAPVIGPAHDPGVATTDRRIDRANREAERALATIAAELRAARIASGLSQTAVAAAAGVSAGELSRIERRAASWLSIRSVSRIAAVVGLETSVRLYPGGSPIRDAAHVALLERLRSRLSPDLRWRSEVPLPAAGDLRAWDAVVLGRGWRVTVEAETRLRDVQALNRRIQLKRRDASVDHVILLVAETRSNRDALRAAGSSLAEDFPLPAARVLGALAAGRDPGGSGIVRM